jgi:hypothetical protein
LKLFFLFIFILFVFNWGDRSKPKTAVSLEDKMRPFYVTIAILASATRAVAKDCRCLPEDDCWPSKSTWDSFNSTVKGALVQVTPIGAVCHDPTYDEAACSDLRANWDDVAIQ